MKRLFLFATALNLLAPLWGQEVVRFDTVHQNVVGSFAVGQGVYETENGYRVFSLQKGLAELSQDIYVTDFDSDGGMLSERTFQSLRQDFFGYASGMVQAGNGHYGGVVRFGAPYSVDSLLLYRFGEDGDTAWSRFIAVDTSWAYRNISRTGNGDLLLTGTHYPPGEAYVFRLDSAGAIKSYHGFSGFYGEDVVEGQDGCWYVGGIGNSGSLINAAVLLRSDTLGNILWQRDLPLYGQYRSLVALRDFGVLGLGSTGDGEDGGFSLAIKYDTTGTQVWRRDLLQSDDQSRASRFHAGFEAVDSTLIMCGWLSRADTYTNGTVVKLDKNGEVLWTRLYSHFEVGGVLPWQMFWDVKPTSDGGLVLTGEANSEDYPYGQLWLLKLDSLGCLVPGCNTVGMEEVVTDLQGRLSVSPNPASEQARVELRCPEGFAPQGDVRLVLVDAQGQEISRQVMVQNLDRFIATVDVQSLTSGTYYVHLADERLWLAGAKLMVEH